MESTKKTSFLKCYPKFEVKKLAHTDSPIH